MNRPRAGWLRMLGATGADVLFGAPVPAWKLAAPPRRAHPAHELRARRREPATRAPQRDLRA